MRGEGVNDPRAIAVGFDHCALAEVGEVLRDFDLRSGENGLEMADAKRAMRKQMQDAQARLITEAFVNFDQVHWA